MKLAVVLFSLGGPDRPEAVEPFLYNLFNDPAIIGAPWPLRPMLAKLISKRRGPVAREIYAQLGGASPLLANTREQAAALEKLLAVKLPDHEVCCFVCMRYWHPMSSAVAAEVAVWGAEAVLLLPMYPQFSTTTSGSSIADWRKSAANIGFAAPTRTVCCYPTLHGFLEAVAEPLREAVERAGGPGRCRVLYSAHGLPEKIVQRGDPYQWQVEQTAARLDHLLGPGHDTVICYQSRVGPLKWIGPATEAEIERAGRDGKNVVIVPVAFVSEHSETLVELDIEYRALADAAGIAVYERAPTVGSAPAFIEGLADAAAKALQTRDVAPPDGRRLCPPEWGGCPCVNGEGAERAE